MINSHESTQFQDTKAGDTHSKQNKNDETPPLMPCAEFLENATLLKKRVPSVQRLLIPRSTIQMIGFNQQRLSKSPFSNPKGGNLNSFDSAYKANNSKELSIESMHNIHLHNLFLLKNIVQYINQSEKKNSEMRFLKKHLQYCEFFQNYATPLGDDVLESCIQKLKIKECESNTYIVNKGDQINNMYILISGSVVKSKQKIQRTEDLLPISDLDVMTPNDKTPFTSFLNKQSSSLIPLSPMKRNLLQNQMSFQSCGGDSPSSQSSKQDKIKITPINSLLEQSFLQRGISQFYIYNEDETVYAYITSEDFVQCVQNSKNSELIQHLNGIRQSLFLSEWPIVKLKPIVTASTIQSFQINQYVYKQNEESSHWYLVLEGEFEYEKEISFNNEINDIVKACLNPVSHEFKKQSIVTDENQKGKSVIRVSILQKGEIFGIEDLIPKSTRQYSVKCLSNVGSVRQINETILLKYLSKNQEEAKKLTTLAEQKNIWLEKSTREKKPMNQQIQNTILESKRNRAIQMIKLKEETKDFDMSSLNSSELASNINDHKPILKNNRRSMFNMPTLQTSQNAGNSDMTRDWLGLADTPPGLKDSNSLLKAHAKPNIQHSKFHHQKSPSSNDIYLLCGNNGQFSLENGIKTPLNLVQPEKNVTFLKPTIEGEDKQKGKMDKQLSVERKQMKLAKEDLLSQYRVSIDRYITESKQKLYKKIELKKLGADLYLKQNHKFNKKDMGESSLSKTVRGAGDHSSFSPIKQIPKLLLKQRDIEVTDEISESQNLSLQQTSRHTSRVLSDYNSKSPESLLQLNLKTSMNQLSNNQKLRELSPLIQSPQNIHTLISPRANILNSPSRKLPSQINTDRVQVSLYNNLIVNNDSQQGEQSSPLLGFSRKLFLPSKTKKILFVQPNQGSSHSPSSSILEKYNMSTQASSFFKKGNEILEQIVSARNQSLTTQQHQRKTSCYSKLSELNNETQQPNKYHHGSFLKNDLMIIKDIKTKISNSQKRSSSTHK